MDTGIFVSIWHLIILISIQYPLREKNMKYSNRVFRQACMMAVLGLGLFLLMVTTAYAGSNDFKLERLCGDNCHSETAIDDFAVLARTYGALVAPMHFQPASTIGQEGFEIGVETKLSFATEDASFWKAINKNNPGDSLVASSDGKYSAPDVFSTIQVSMRKGLPFSLEIEGVANWLVDSEIFYIGAGLRWAITEGWWFLPDISVRGHVGTIVGAAQISMINVNVDAAMSYTWGLGGIVSITPYAGYSLLVNVSSSRPLAIYAGDEFTEEVFRQKSQYISRGFVGFQLKAEYFIFDAEGEFGKDVKSLGLKIGAQF
jgi:hypothetical protein